MFRLKICNLIFVINAYYIVNVHCCWQTYTYIVHTYLHLQYMKITKSRACNYLRYRCPLIPVLRCYVYSAVVEWLFPIFCDKFMWVLWEKSPIYFSVLSYIPYKKKHGWNKSSGGPACAEKHESIKVGTRHEWQRAHNNPFWEVLARKCKLDFLTWEKKGTPWNMSEDRKSVV